LARRSNDVEIAHTRQTFKLFVNHQKGANYSIEQARHPTFKKLSIGQIEKGQTINIEHLCRCFFLADIRFLEEFA